MLYYIILYYIILYYIILYYVILYYLLLFIIILLYHYIELFILRPISSDKKLSEIVLVNMIWLTVLYKAFKVI